MVNLIIIGYLANTLWLLIWSMTAYLKWYTIMRHYKQILVSVRLQLHRKIQIVPFGLNWTAIVWNVFCFNDKEFSDKTTCTLYPISLETLLLPVYVMFQWTAKFIQDTWNASTTNPFVYKLFHLFLLCSNFVFLSHYAYVKLQGITWLFAYRKGGNFNIHIWVWFGCFIY